MAEDALLVSLRAAVTAAPDDVPLRLHLARLLIEADQRDAAVAEIAQALRVDPTSVDARELMTSALGVPAAAPPPEKHGFDWQAAESQVDNIVAPRFVDGAQEKTEEPAYDTERPAVTLADVGGMEEVKERLNAAFLAPMRNPELSKLYGKSLRGGLLLYGPPGCGKTFIARALAGEIGASFIAVGIAEVLDMYIGQSERNLAELFAQARRKAPCVLFFDEVDALGQRRTQTHSGGMRATVNQLLMELDNVQASNDGVFVLAATNQPWDVDTALRRPGRFDRTVLVLPPDEPAREAILRYHLKERPIESIDVAALARRTDGFSGADLAHLCESTAERALMDSARTGNVRMIGMADFDAVLEDVKPSTGPWFDAARSVAMFANEGGAYDELAAYLRAHRML
ncbi:AAA family ATPase [Labedaea rhizosphaerae]|uniref:ATPase family protein associated with various cellular activities (AAA) n=1 Tax=Labedaea rhizosphaerae TaxID=598644 RepID=A0A4R6SNI8_LABRH|nr:AAA family ATPase [Labedaea rhizosphaerae]TDQ05938.1 ATPase family protein associated with various cellular activities (AAA) [Labedaea rhizosphaerae]